ncbi:MAG: amidohydrolase [Flavobacterium sp.]|nr:amidohydrolase [Flavobacterium sp.]
MQPETLKIAWIQTDLEWENPAVNWQRMGQKIAEITTAVDLIVLPELFTTGFTMNAQAVAETMQGDTIAWLQQMAKVKNCAITGSLVIKEKGNFYNRLVFVFPNGDLKTYDKRHLFTLAGEDKVYTAGRDKLIIDYKGFKICPLICYDLRFPVFSRNTEKYDLLLYVANWPSPRIAAWDALLKARAIENCCYVVGVNRLGIDANALDYPGHSQGIDFAGNLLHDSASKAELAWVEINKKELLDFRTRFAFLADQDRFTVED